MDEYDAYKRDTLENLLKTRDDPVAARQSTKAKALVSYALGAALILAASYFLRSVGLVRWAWIGLAAVGGILIAYGAIHEPLRRQFEILQEFVDFDAVRLRFKDLDRR